MQTRDVTISGGLVLFAISPNFGCNLSAKVYAGENPCQNGDFLVGF